MTAIDILLDPGHTMLDVAKVYNATMRQSYPKEIMAKKINQFTFKSESLTQINSTYKEIAIVNFETIVFINT